MFPCTPAQIEKSTSVSAISHQRALRQLLDMISGGVLMCFVAGAVLLRDLRML